jgi:hypothetical protein
VIVTASLQAGIPPWIFITPAHEQKLSVTSWNLYQQINHVPLDSPEDALGITIC